MSGIVDFRTEIEDEDGQPITEANPFPVTSQGLQVLQRVAALLKPLQQISGNGSNRLSIDVNTGNINVTGTITANQGGTWNINNIATYANVNAFDQNRAVSRAAYVTAVRSRIA